METLSIVGSISSITSLIISIIIVYKVIKINFYISDGSSNISHQNKNKVKHGSIVGRDLNN